MIISHKYKFIFIKTSKVAGTSIEMFLTSVCGESDICTPFWHPEPNHLPRNFRGLFNPCNEILYRLKLGRKAKKSGIGRTVKDCVKRNKFFEPMPAWQVRARIDPNIWRTYYKFTVERNPWDKIVSRYYHSREVYRGKYKKDLSLENFLSYLSKQMREPWSTPAWGSPAPYNYPRYTDPLTGDLLVDKVVRYENLNQELGDVFGNLGIPFSGSLSHRAKNHYRTLRKPYWDELSDEQIQLVGNLFTREIDLIGYAPTSKYSRILYG